MTLRGGLRGGLYAAEEPPIFIDFGNQNRVREKARMVLVIRNNTPITTRVTLGLQKFGVEDEAGEAGSSPTRTPRSLKSSRSGRSTSEPTRPARGVATLGTAVPLHRSRNSLSVPANQTLRRLSPDAVEGLVPRDCMHVSVHLEIAHNLLVGLCVSRSAKMR